jgi:uncharacterized protein YcfL
MKVALVRSLIAGTLCTGCAAALLLQGGCATTSGMEVSGTVLVDTNPSVLHKSIVINNSGLAGDIEISDMKSDIVGTMLLIQASIHSKRSDTALVQYKFDWFDTQGFEIPANQAWKPLVLNGRETVTIQGVAPDPMARGFKLKIRAQEESE